jgi:hypothetical protein
MKLLRGLNGGAHSLGAQLKILGERKVPFARCVGQCAFGGQLLARCLPVQEVNARVQSTLPIIPRAISITELRAVQALLSVESATENGL